MVARILVAVNAAAFAGAMLRSETPAQVPENFALGAVTVEPALLGMLCALYVLSPALKRWPQALAIAAVLGLSAVVVVAVSPLMEMLVQPQPGWQISRDAFNAVLIAALLLLYFDLRQKAFSPALAEARLQALQARIRPHFLFNSLNAVLSLVRRDPKRAEVALEDLADLFRSVLSDSRQLVPLADEVALTRQYLALEQLRLGERLVAEWHIDADAEPALVPPMLLQPLVENAVYHGIEPGLEPGVVRISAERQGDRVKLVLSNPYHPDHQHRQGNRMALANIGERLQLHFDLEGTLRTSIEQDRFTIEIDLPLRRSA